MIDRILVGLILEVFPLTYERHNFPHTALVLDSCSANNPLILFSLLGAYSKAEEDIT